MLEIVEFWNSLWMGIGIGVLGCVEIRFVILGLHFTYVRPNGLHWIPRCHLDCVTSIRDGSSASMRFQHDLFCQRFTMNDGPIEQHRISLNNWWINLRGSLANALPQALIIYTASYIYSYIFFPSYYILRRETRTAQDLHTPSCPAPSSRYL